MSNFTAHKFLGSLLMALVLIGPGVLLAGSDTSAPDGKDNSKDYSKEAPPPVKSWCETPKPFEIRIGLPGWIAGISGDSGVKGLEASSDVTFDQLLKHLTHVPIVLSADAHYQRWELFGDGQFLKVGTGATLPGLLFTSADIHLSSGLVEGFVGYRFINCDKATFSFFAGARYTYLGGDFSVFDNGDARLDILRELLGLHQRLSFSDNTGWVDPVIGVRGKVKIWKATSLYAQVDGGGFNANSGSAFALQREGPRDIVKVPIDSTDWSYQVQGGLEFQITHWLWLQGGWRYLKYNYVKDGFTYKPQLNGPQLQLGVNF
jgi:hypothetical protein